MILPEKGNRIWINIFGSTSTLVVCSTNMTTILIVAVQEFIN